MKIFLCVMLLLASFKLLAQKSKPDTVIKRDTVNLRGYVYDRMGKPIKYIRFESTNTSMDAPSWHIGAFTDSTGYFELNGAKFNDTLTFEKNVLYNIIPIYNKGSRYMVVYLASAPTIDITAQEPISVAAVRKHRKLTPSFKIFYSTANIDNFELHAIPEFKGGNKRFIELIKQQLHYPQKAIDNDVEGTVTVGFQIERDGSPVNFKILKGVGYGCEDALINIIKSLPRWRPAIENGRPVLMSQTV